MMIVVIDGYNLIKQVLQTTRISHAQRDKFIVQIAQYLKKCGLNGVIIFDGGESSYPSREKKGNMTIIFSGYKESADEVIAQYLQEHREYELLIVSSDRAVRQYAETLGKQTIAATDFYYKYIENKPVPQSGSKDQTLFKISDESPHELDVLMQEASQNLEIKKEDFPEKEMVRHKSVRKLSKDARKRKKIIDKLK